MKSHMKLLGENSRDINNSTLNVNEPSSCFMKSYSMLYALLDFITCFMFYKTLLAYMHSRRCPLYSFTHVNRSDANEQLVNLNFLITPISDHINVSDLIAHLLFVFYQLFLIIQLTFDGISFFLIMDYISNKYNECIPTRFRKGVTVGRKYCMLPNHTFLLKCLEFLLKMSFRKVCGNSLHF